MNGALPSALTKKPVKVTLIATDRICENFQRQNAAGVYASANEYRADVIAIEREIVKQLADAGCPYIQHDAPSYTAYVDAKSLERMRGLGIDPMRQMTQSIDADNAVIDGITRRHFRHSSVPRQRAQHVASRRRLRRHRREAVQQPATTIAFFWNTTPSAPAAFEPLALRPEG